VAFIQAWVAEALKRGNADEGPGAWAALPVAAAWRTLTQPAQKARACSTQLLRENNEIDQILLLTSVF
jgi:hypothetical protein